MVTSVRWMRFPGGPVDTFEDLGTGVYGAFEATVLFRQGLTPSGADCGHCRIYFFQFYEAHFDLRFAKLSVYPVAG